MSCSRLVGGILADSARMKTDFGQCYAGQVAVGMARSQCFAKTGSEIAVGRVDTFPGIGAAAGTPDIQFRQERCIFHKSDHPLPRDSTAAVGQIAAVAGMVVGIAVDCVVCSGHVSPLPWITS